MEKLGQASLEYNHLTHLSLLISIVNLFPKFYLSLENGNKIIKDLSLLPVWDLFAEQSEILIQKLLLKIPQYVNVIPLSPDRIPHLARDIAKVLTLLEAKPGVIPFLLSPFQTTAEQSMLNLDSENSNSDLSSLTSFKSRKFPGVVLNQILTILSPNKFPVIANKDFKPYVLVDYNNLQVLPDDSNPDFINFIRANYKNHLIMGNVCLSNSIFNFHLQKMKDKKPLSEQKIKERYPGCNPIFFDIKTDDGWKAFLKMWRLLNFKQVASSCLITQEGTAVFFTQNFEGKPITRKTQNWEELNPEDQAKQNFLRMVFTLIKVGGYEIYIWLKNYGIIDKSVLVPGSAITPELIAVWMNEFVRPMDDQTRLDVEDLPTEDVLELVDDSKFRGENEALLDALLYNEARFSSEVWQTTPQ